MLKSVKMAVRGPYFGVTLRLPSSRRQFLILLAAVLAYGFRYALEVAPCDGVSCRAYREARRSNLREPCRGGCMCDKFHIAVSC